MKLLQLVTVVLACFGICQHQQVVGLDLPTSTLPNHFCVIVVSTDGVDSVKCWENSSLPCASLHFALTKPNLNNTLVIMKIGIHNLSRNVEVDNMHNFSLRGEISSQINNSSRINIINCTQKNVSLSFKMCSNLSFSDFEVNNCGGEYVSTSKSPKAEQGKSNFSMIWTAIYFERCLHMSFIRVQLSDNVGMNAIMYDVGGTVYFEGVNFRRNIKKEYYLKNIGLEMNYFPALFIPGYSSGGGLYIELTLKSVSDLPLGYYVSNSQWIFNNSNFVNNTAENEDSKLSVEGLNYISFGRGGGLSIIIRANATNNHFLINNCTFIDNIALWGAGLFLEFHDNAQNNSVIVSDSYFRSNSAVYGGGGIRVGTTLQSLSTRNFIIINSSKVTRNRAKVGGGFSQYRLSNTGKKSETTHLNDCTFDFNFGVIGSAVHLIFTHMHITDSNITGNTPYTFDEESKNMIGQGCLYCSQSEVFFRGNNEFRSNENSAVVLDASQVIIHNNLTFVNNSGLDGGAVALYGYSLVRLIRNSHIDFINNTATKKGGAIYFDGAEPPLAPFSSTEYIMYNYSCCIILGDYDTEDAEPETFPTQINFISNLASPSSGNAIFATSVAACRRWGEPRYNNTALKWKIFNYSLNAEPVIVTNPIKIETNRFYWRTFPGKYFQPSITLRDENWNSVHGTIRVTVKPLTKGFVFVSGSNLFVIMNSLTTVRLKGRENDRFSILLETISEVPVQFWMHDLKLQRCPFGFYQPRQYSSENSTCKCLVDSKYGTSKIGVTYCSGNNAFILKGRWANPQESHQGNMDFAEHMCPRHYCNSSYGRRQAIDYIFRKKTQCAKHRQWDSTLCGACERQYSVKFGSEVCAMCKDTDLFFILLLIAVLSLFVLFVVLLNVNTYSTYLNAYLYSYQVIPLLYDFEVKDPFISGVISLSGFAGSGSTNVGICLWNGMTDISKMAFNYVIPSYIIIFTAIILKLSVYLQHRVVGNRVHQLRTFLFDRNASLYACGFIAVVAYSDFTRITLMLLCPAHVNSKWVLYYAGEVGFFSKEHIPYAILAFLVLFFVLLFPIIVMFPYIITGRLPWSNRILGTFQQCFRDELRLFSGFYFVCRFVLLVTYMYTQSNALRYGIILFFSIIFATIFTAFRPYNNDAMNIFDTVLLANISIIAGLNALSEGVVEYQILKALQIWTHVHVYLPLIGLLVHFAYWLYQRYLEWNNNPNQEPEQRPTSKFPARVTELTPLLDQSGSYDRNVQT